MEPRGCRWAPIARTPRLASAVTPRPFIAAAAERANAAARLVPKHPEQQPMVRSLLRDGPRDPSWLCCAGVCPGSRARGALRVGAQGVQGRGHAAACRVPGLPSSGCRGTGAGCAESAGCPGTPRGYTPTPARRPGRNAGARLCTGFRLLLLPTASVIANTDRAASTAVADVTAHVVYTLVRK